MSKLDEMIGIAELKRKMYEIWNHSTSVERLIERLGNIDNDESTKKILIERLHNKHQSAMKLLDDLLRDDEKD